MYPSRAYPVFINMKQVGVSLPLPLPLPGWNASLQKKWRSLNSPQKRTEEQPNSRKTEQWHREGKVEGGWVSRERGVGKQGEKGLLSAHVFKILRRIYTGIVLTSIRGLLTVCWKFTFFHQGLDLSMH